MVTINDESIKKAYTYVLTLRNVVVKETNHVKSNKAHVDKIVPSNLVNVYSKKHQDALKFVDDLTQTLYDLSVVTLVTAFEKVVFNKYKNTYGILRTVVSVSTTPLSDFHRSRERFINDSIDKLSGILFLIDGIIDANTMSLLKEIKDHRNYIVHGKRDSVMPARQLDIDIIAKTLDDAITEISLRSV